MQETKTATAVVVDMSRSANAKLRPVPLTAVTLEDTFLEPRRKINREATIQSQYRQCEDTGRIDNLRRASGRKTGLAFQGIFFNDSDVYKWLEAAAWSLASHPDAGLAKMVDDTIDEVAAAQQPDGYLNSYFMFERARERWTNLKDMHEMYCAGHLIQSAVAHYRATGSRRLLDVACRLADHIASVFGPVSEGKRHGACGHEEIEMALVELARATGQGKYLKQAKFFIDIRGNGAPAGGDSYRQDHKPFRELDRMIGHAVRAVYLNAGAADVCAETGDASLMAAMERLWQNMTLKQLYISSGIGSRWEGEAFGRDYELPNERAYTETCAAIGSLMWNWRLLLITGEARFADLIETTLYNAILPGLSLDGQAYFYQNPLADDGTHRRQAWFGCACCPPNVARLLSSLTGYFHSTSGRDELWVHLYAQGKAQVALPDGRTVALVQRTQYPWDGQIELQVNSAGRFALLLRIPSWCQVGAAKLTVNGQPAGDAYLTPGSYARVEREWKAGDVVKLALPMPVRRVQCHPHVPENAGRAALMRGPLLYCVEQVDHPGVDVRDLVLSPDARLTSTFREDLLGGVVVIQGQAQVSPPDADWTGRLYRAVDAGSVSPQRRTVPLTAVPYYAWANRDAGAMRVWIAVV